MNREEQILTNRLLELAEHAYQRGIPMYSNFLNLNEQNLFKNMVTNMPPISYDALGGYNLAERQLIAFIPQGFDTSNAPIDVVVIKPLNSKFAEDLNHRDFLGTILGLGIERSQIGDIVISNHIAYVFCIRKMSSFIINNLTRVKHTPVLCSIGEFNNEVSIHFTEISGSVSSVRLDSILALCFGSSRSSIISTIEEGKVFINGKIITTNSYSLKQNDIISVRGLGKFQYIGTSTMSKKGRYIVTINKYI